MHKTIFYLAALCLAVSSCTKDKTDYHGEMDTETPVFEEFKEAVTAEVDNYTVLIETKNGLFYTGYNEIRLKITDSRTNQLADVSKVTFVPHQHALEDPPGEDYFVGYAVFTSESNTSRNWEIAINFTVDNQDYSLHEPISVAKQSNKNLAMTAFVGNDEKEYVIALVAPQKPTVGENKLIAGIYRRDEFRYEAVRNYSLLLDPRMPEPSMGNHSSPNNQDLTPQDDGLYHGQVNYTMTGNWTLNFILINPDGQIIKGTNVPTDFTPGVEGIKSELHIDIIF